MGRPMARNLLAPAMSFDGVQPLSRAGRRTGGGRAPHLRARPRNSRAESDVIITIVTDSPDVEEVVAGERGVHPRRPSRLRGASTCPPSRRRWRESRGAPSPRKGVGHAGRSRERRRQGAREEGRFRSWSGATEAAFEAALPVLQAMGRTIVHVGGPGMGQTVKLCNQVICGLNLLATAEGLALAAKAGADPEKVLQVVTEGAAGSWMLKNLGPKMAAGITRRVHGEAAAEGSCASHWRRRPELGLPLPGTALVQQLFRSVEAMGAWQTRGRRPSSRRTKRLGDVRVAKRTGGQPDA